MTFDGGGSSRALRLDRMLVFAERLRNLAEAAPGAVLVDPGLKFRDQKPCAVHNRANGFLGQSRSDGALANITKVMTSKVACIDNGGNQAQTALQIALAKE